MDIDFVVWLVYNCAKEPPICLFQAISLKLKPELIFNQDFQGFLLC